MAHFAEINENNIVLRVLVVDDLHEHRGEEYLSQDLGFGGRWIQTSYNTVAGEHKNGGTPLRKNYAGIGYIYDEQRDAFIPPKDFDSWILNEDKCLWEPPIAYPEDGNLYFWNEENKSWDLANN